MEGGLLKLEHCLILETVSGDLVVGIIHRQDRGLGALQQRAEQRCREPAEGGALGKAFMERLTKLHTAATTRIDFCDFTTDGPLNRIPRLAADPQH